MFSCSKINTMTNNILVEPQQQQQMLNLYITHVNKEGPFLKVWGQTDKNKSHFVEQFLQSAAKQFDQGFGEIPFANLQVGTFVCAKYRDNKYYRARITNIDYLHDSCLEVLFLDFGNQDTILAKNIRSPQSFPPSFISLPPLATEFIFAEAHTPGGGEWNDNIFEIISKELRYRDLQGQLVAQATQYYLIKLFLEGTDIGSVFINKNLLQPIPLHAQQAVLLSMSLQKKSPMTPYPSTATAEINSYKASVLEPQQHYQVYVSFVNDGPTLFSVQLKQSEHILSKLMTDINAISLTMLEDVPLPGTICLARCLEDGNVCRAVVTNEVDNNFKVYYVDFGNYEILPLEYLYQIPFKYVLPKVMAIRLSLNGVEKSAVTMDMMLAFKKFVDNRLLSMKVLPSIKKATIHKCELWDIETNTNALDVINRAAKHAYPDPLLLNRGFMQLVKISYVYSCSRFYVQLIHKEEELTKLMNDLQASCELNDEITLPEIRVGLPCCAQFEDDNLWYRSEVLRINDDYTVQVRYIDYGNEGQVSIHSLKMVDGELLTVLRPQAIECCLNGYQNMPDDGKRDNLFAELILEETFTMKVNEMLGKKALVELIDSSNYNVASLLLEKIAGTTCQVSPLLVQAGNKIEHRKSVSSDISDGSRSGGTRKQSKDNFWANKTERNSAEKSWRSNNSENSLSPHRNDKPKENGWRKDENKRNNRTSNSRNDRNQSSVNDRITKYKNDYQTKTYRNNTSQQDSWESGSNKASSDSYKADGNTDRSRYERKPRHDSPRDRYDNRNGRNGQAKDGFRKNFRRTDGASASSGSEKSFKQDKSKYGQSRNGFKNDYRQSPKSYDSWDKTTNKSESLDLAQSTDEFGQLCVISNESAAVAICWFHNPCHFYCQLEDNQYEFKQMMEDIQNTYRNRKHDSYPVGAPVITLFPEDNVFYRARISDLVCGKFKVVFVDFGNVSTVDKVWGIEKKFMKLPAQAIRCTLKGIGPNGDNWSDCSVFAPYFGKDAYSSRFLDTNDGTTSVELSYNGDDVAQQLIEGKLAKPLQSAQKIDAAETEIHTSLLLSQQIRVTLKSINNLSDIIVATEFGVALSCKAHNLDIATDIYLHVLKEYLNKNLIIFVDNILENNVLDVTFYEMDGSKIVILEPDEGAFESIDPLCPLPIFKSHISGYVSHVDETSIYLQPNDCADKLKKLLDDMAKEYEGIEQESIIVPEEGMNYAVRRSSGNWYRIKVLNFDDETASIVYIDYGDTENIPFTELRELQSKFYVPDVLCVQIVVASDSPESFLGKNVMVETYFGETNWEGIVEEYNLTTESPPAEPEQKQKEEENEREAIAEPIEVKGTPVYVSHVDSPTEFYVQLYDSHIALTELHENLQVTAPDLPVLENITIGVLCAAPYSVDSEWYRAEVLDADDDITTVRFVDYGNTDVINNKTTQIKTLPSNLLSLAVYATRCSLKLKAIEDEWSQTALELFNNLIQQDEHITAEFLIQDEKTNIVELYSNGQNLKDILLVRNHAVPCEIVTESKTTCYVSHSNSPSEFWVQLENCVDELEWIAEQLANASVNFPELDDMSPGTLCAALFADDEMWYRARILSNTIAGIELIFIDYGNTCVSTSLRQLPEELVVTPPLAQKCCLQRPDGLPYWTKEAHEKFNEIAAEGQTVFEIRKITTGETATIELLLNGESIVEKLLPVTKDGYIRNFESLDKFNLELNDTVLSETYSLEAMPDIMWDDKSNSSFLVLYPKGTLFDIEFVNDGVVRLYHNKNDIRVNLGGTKINLNSFVSQTIDDNVDRTEEEKVDVIDDVIEKVNQEVENRRGEKEGDLEKMIGDLNLNNELQSNIVDDSTVSVSVAVLEPPTPQPSSSSVSENIDCSQNESLIETSITSYESCAEPLEKTTLSWSLLSDETNNIESIITTPTSSIADVDLLVNNAHDDVKVTTALCKDLANVNINDIEIKQIEQDDCVVSIDDNFQEKIDHCLNGTIEASNDANEKVSDQQCHVNRKDGIKNVSDGLVKHKPSLTETEENIVQSDIPLD